MREQTALPHDYIFVGRPWTGATGNFDTSRSPIDMIVLHTMVGTLTGSTAHFKNSTVNTSAHYGIDSNGQLVQWIPESATAYHAGRYEVNQRSIGIEHEDLGQPNNPRPDALYQASSRLVADIAKTYNIKLDRDHVKKHNEIVATNCPGSLDIDRILAGAKALLQPTEATHQYELPPSVFTAMVTKSSEYDEIWKALKLPEELKGNVGSHKLIIDFFNQKLTEARMLPSNPVYVVPTPPAAPEIPQPQSKSVWKTDIKDMLTNILTILKLKK